MSHWLAHPDLLVVTEEPIYKWLLAPGTLNHHHQQWRTHASHQPFLCVHDKNKQTHFNITASDWTVKTSGRQHFWFYYTKKKEKRKMNSQSESCCRFNTLNLIKATWGQTRGTLWKQATGGHKETAKRHPKDHCLCDDDAPLEHGVNNGSQRLSYYIKRWAQNQRSPIQSSVTFNINKNKDALPIRIILQYYGIITFNIYEKWRF